MLSSHPRCHVVNIQRRRRKRHHRADANGLDDPVTDAANVFRANLIYWMTKLEWTNANMARAIEKSPSSITHYRSGRMSPELDVCGRIARALGIPLSELFQDPPYQLDGAPPRFEVVTHEKDKAKVATDLDIDQVMAQLGKHFGLDVSVRKPRKKKSKKQGGK
jgi:DNA-binding XRE family transcriptional regulator